MKAIAQLVLVALCLIILKSVYDARVDQENAARKGRDGTPLPSQTSTAQQPVPNKDKPVAKVWNRKAVTGEWAQQQVNTSSIGAVGGSYQPPKQAPKKEYRTMLDRPAY